MVEPGANSTRLLNIGRLAFMPVVVVMICGLRASGLPSEQNTRVFAAAGVSDNNASGGDGKGEAWGCHAIFSSRVADRGLVGAVHDRQGQVDGEARPVAEPALDVDAALQLGRDEVVDDVQAEPRAAAVAAVVKNGSKIFAEMLGRDAAAVIGEGDADHARSERRGGDRQTARSPGRIGVDDRVHDEVGEDLREAARISVER